MSNASLWAGAAHVLLGWGVFTMGASQPWGYVPLMAGMTTYAGAAFLTHRSCDVMGRGLLFSLATIGSAILFQLVPLPDDVINAIGPASILVADTQAPRRPISIDPDATALSLAFMVALSLFFAGALRTIGPGVARRLSAGLIFIGTVVALVGIAQEASWAHVYRAAWVTLPPDSSPLGPFSSKNHYVAWILMTLALTLGYLCGVLERLGARWGLGGLPWVEIGRVVVLESAAVVMAVAVVQTRSRAGILCLGLAIVMMIGLLLRRRANIRTRLLAASPVMLLLLTGILITGVRPIVNRFGASSWSTAHGRVPIWRQATKIARDFPITGSGLNTYQTIVTFYPTAELDEPYEAAHNGFLQLAGEGGLLVGLPVLATVGFFIRETRQRFREASGDTVIEWLRIGAVVGLWLVAVQETVDFSLQVPANAALFVVLAAIAVHRSRKPTKWDVHADRGEEGNEFACSMRMC